MLSVLPSFLGNRQSFARTYHLAFQSRKKLGSNQARDKNNQNIKSRANQLKRRTKRIKSKRLSVFWPPCVVPEEMEMALAYVWYCVSQRRTVDGGDAHAIPYEQADAGHEGMGRCERLAEFLDARADECCYACAAVLRSDWIAAPPESAMTPALIVMMVVQRRCLHETNIKGISQDDRLLQILRLVMIQWF